ncbi:MAG: MipA/OmpV family protein [Pseudolabrys sp.]
MTYVSAAAAQPPAPASTDWTITIGAEGRVLPKFEGSASAMLRPFPLFDARRAGTPENFRSPVDGFSFSFLDYGRFHIGPTTKIKFARKEGDDANLRGLGDVSMAFEAGAFAEYWVADWLRTRVEVRQGFGGHHGVVGEATADLVIPVTPKLTLSGGPRLTVATAAATDPYFSVTPAQSAASGLAIYSAGGGLRAYGAGVQARYEWSPQWATHVFLEYERLAAPAANSPLVTRYGTSDQIQVGMGVTYSFNMKALW